jgi:hypothetical protein
MMQEVKQTTEEKTKMYSKISKRKLIEMLITCNDIISSRPPEIINHFGATNLSPVNKGICSFCGKPETLNGGMTELCTCPVYSKEEQRLVFEATKVVYTKETHEKMTKYQILTDRQIVELSGLFYRQRIYAIKIQTIAIADSGEIRISYIEYISDRFATSQEELETYQTEVILP